MRQVCSAAPLSAGATRVRAAGTPSVKSTPKLYPNGLASSMGSIISYSSSSANAQTASPVVPSASRAHVSNYSSTVGSTIWTGSGSPGNRSYYPLPLGRHTFSSRWTMPMVAAQPW